MAEKTAPEGKRTIVELENGTQAQIMPGDPIPEGAKVVGSEKIELREDAKPAAPGEPEPDTGPVRTAETKSPRRSSKKKG